jgi:LAS superfamily LD-carboxypeptidase LdcB
MAAVVSFAAPAAAQTNGGNGGSTKAQLDKVRAQRAAKAAQIDATRASNGDLQQALDALSANVKGQQANYATAKRKAADAAAALSRSQQAEQDQQAAVDALANDLKAAALKAYTSPASDLDALLTGGTNSLADVVMRRTLMGLQSRDVRDALDQYDAARQDLTTKRKLATKASQTASKRQQDAAVQLVSLKNALSQQGKVLADSEVRLDDLLSEADGLAGLDAKLSAQYNQEQADLAARLAAMRAAAIQAASDAGGGDPTAPFNGPIPPITGSGPIVNVGGINVSADIASQVAGLLAAAQAAGFVMSGGGYRSPAAQIAVRRNNCGSSSYDIYQKPPSACRPPAARPGQSMHEQGKAIDFVCNGALITSRASACWRWLANNAARFGLQNLPSEPWHWSTNGM